ncbi:hypothetical protein M2352_002390 [Azospirillum fermentarium]|uniref:hypothetical protein n=1 Tax=Azospirillum fermentarium TaxID=1233114 RepID=UPI00222633EE|nr:hypothetical protein [Azospirillum fermentarium]MCW2246799.1 hypothetical protein [Azospirillum fermentarium]
MRASSPSNLMSRMITMAANPTMPAAEDQSPARVQRIIWTAQAAKLHAAMPAFIAHQIECRVAAELDAMELPEIFFTSVEVADRVITCDLDSSGTASIFGVIDSAEYEDLVEDAGEDALFGVDWDGVYVTPARTRH